MLNRAVDTGFLALVFSLAFMQPDWERFGPALTLTEPLFLLTAALFFVAVIAGRMKFRLDRIYILFAIYAAAMTLSAVFADNLRYSFFRLLGELYLIALAILTINVVGTSEMMKKVVAVWLVASGVSALIGTLAVLCFYLGVTNVITDLAFHYYGTLPPGNYVRIQGTFLYPSMLCNYLTVSFMMLLAARRLVWIGKTPFVMLLVLFSITAAFTVTPGLGGLLLAIGTWMSLVSRVGRRTVTSKLALAGGIVAAAAFQLVSTFTPINYETSPYHFELAGTRIDPTPRLVVWEEALWTFLRHPFVGKGVGQNAVEVSVLPPHGQMQLITDAHNVLLSVGAQEGILGVAAILMIIVTVLRRTLPFDISRENALRTALGIAFVSAFLVQGLVGSFEDARHLWFLMGLIASCAVLGPASRRPIQNGVRDKTKTASP